MSSVAVPHAVTQDNVYAGYFIPKGLCCSLIIYLYSCLPTHTLPGAIVIGNTWYNIFPQEFPVEVAQNSLQGNFA